VAAAVPELLVGLDRAIVSGAVEARAWLEARLHEFIEWVERFPTPVAIRLAVGFRGLKTGPPALPLSPRRLALGGEFEAWFRGWLPEVLKETKSV
jgi:dihydrodipicolinate synthase/N-acetylneuraminate lyase